MWCTFYYKNFNLNSNHILTKCLMHLKIGREYDTKLFGEDSTSLEEKIDPLSIGINPCWSRSEFVEVDKERIDPLRSRIDPWCKCNKGSILGQPEAQKLKYFMLSLPKTPYTLRFYPQINLLLASNDSLSFLYTFYT